MTKDEFEKLKKLAEEAVDSLSFIKKAEKDLEKLEKQSRVVIGTPGNKRGYRKL